MDSMYIHRNITSALEHNTVSKEGPQATFDLSIACLQGLDR